MRTLEFDLTGYLPGAHSLSGWIVGQLPIKSLADIFKEGLRVNVRNLHKIRKDAVNLGMFLAFLNDVGDLSRNGVEIMFYPGGQSDESLWSLSHCFS